MPNVSKPKTTSAPRRKSPVAEASLRIARRERRRERSREEIIDAARRVLLRNGVAATTLDAIALEVGLTKAALYYYYPSKDALFFEIVFGAYESEARAIHDAVEATMDGGAALRAVVRATMNRFATRMDDFRIAYLQPQVGKPSTVRFTAEQFAKIRPLNDLAYAGATKKLGAFEPCPGQRCADRAASRDIRRALRGAGAPHYEGARRKHGRSVALHG